MKKFDIGIQLYGLRNSMAADFEGTLAKVAQMGYNYVEFAGYYGKSGQEIAEILKRYGLKCVSVHQSIDFFEKDLHAGAEFLKAFGVKYSVIPWYNASELSSDEAWKKTSALFLDVAKGLSSEGMMLGYHNHDFEFELVGGKYIHDRIFEAVPKNLIFPEIDTCWVKYAGLDPAEKIRQFKGRVPVVHLKDFFCTKTGGAPVYALIDENGKEIKKNSREDNGFEFRPLGRGIQNFGEIISACEECGTDLLVVEQDQTYDMSELEAAEISRMYLRDNFGM